VRKLGIPTVVDRMVQQAVAQILTPIFERVFSDNSFGFRPHRGGPLSPILANIYLNELDKELTRRGHHFVRYADDCNIYVKSQR
ncbi:reverse transcriptase domain-containing protein, partial [Limosilactobacillus reuteri]|uniref:reverse transcriptase domain-containing protein n=1 Tax=Limosilactobacillus reuteri TaxID=1598 RepID=UPI002B053845